MSGNSWPQRLAHGADRDRLARRGRRVARRIGQLDSGVRVVGDGHQRLRNASLYLPIWSSSPSVELVGLDPAAVDVGAVQRAAVVEVVVAAAADEDRVVARDGHVVEEDVAVGPAADREPVVLEREALAGPPAAGADHQRRAARRPPRRGRPPRSRRSRRPCRSPSSRRSAGSDWARKAPHRWQ